MGAYNALDELLPGPAAESDERRLEAVSPPRPPEREREWSGDRQWEQPQDPAPEPRRAPGFNALDELLPGPLAARRRLQLVPGRSRSGTRGQGEGESKHLSDYNPLDGLLPEDPPPKARVSLRVSTELLEAARNASAYLSYDEDRVTLGELAEDALRAELHRLSAEHNSGRPFPPRADDHRRRRAR